MDDNYYLLLDLDPDQHTTWATIEPVFKKKRGEWSSQKNGAGPAAQDANVNLSKCRLIEAELKDDGRRKAQADAARGLFAARQALAQAGIDELLRLAGASGYLTPDAVKAVADKGKRGVVRWTEAEVKARVAVVGLQVRAAPPPPPPDSGRLDDSLIDAIRQSLTVVDKADLYAYLGATPTTTRARLKQLADDEYADVRRYAVKDAKVTARGVLVGQCQNLFGTDALRARYDATLRWLELEEVRMRAEMAGIGEGRIPLAVVEDLVRRGADKGVDRPRVLAAVQEVAGKKGWIVEAAASGTVAADTQRCGHCPALNPAAATACRRCNRPLVVDCPKCGAKSPTAAPACDKCQFAVADMPLAEPRLRLARQLSQTEPAEARKLVAEALTYWPNHPQAVDLLRDLDRRDQEERDRQKGRDQELARLVGALNAARTARTYLKARDELAALERFDRDYPGLASFRKEIDDAVQAAGAKRTEAEGLLRQGKTDDAADAFAVARGRCDDLPGVSEGLARCPPAPPPSAAATASPASIAVSWGRSPSRGAVEYQVVRKAGSQPTHPGDGQPVARTSGLAHTDPSADPGRAYWYAVFAVRGGVTSTAAVTKPEVRAAEVDQLQVTSGDGRVNLTWAAVANARGYEVWRQPGPPPARGQGARLTGLLGPSVTDDGLVNGTAYGYRVVAVYGGPDGGDLVSGGTTAVATPAAPPRPVTDLRISRDGAAGFEAVWSRPPTGAVQLYRVGDPAAARFRPGQLLRPADLAPFGSPLPPAGPGVVRGPADPTVDLHLLPVTVLGSAAVAGQLVSQGWVDDVPAVRAEAAGGMLRLWFDFPAGHDLAVVVVRSDQHPDGPDDPKAARHTHTRGQNKADGGFRCPAPVADRVYATVYVAASRDGRQRYSPGRPVTVPVRDRRRVRVRLDWQKRFLVPTGDLTVTLTPDAPTALPGLVLVARLDGYPQRPDEGEVVARLPPGPAGPGQPARVVVPAPRIPDLRYARVFPADPADAGWLELVPG